MKSERPANRIEQLDCGGGSKLDSVGEYHDVPSVEHVGGVGVVSGFGKGGGG